MARINIKTTPTHVTHEGAPAKRITAEQVRRFDETKAFDISDARRDFGYDPVPFEEGLRLSER